MKQESTVADNCNLLLFTCPQPRPVEKWEKVRNNLWHCYDHTCNQIIAKAFQMSIQFIFNQEKKVKKI